MKNIIYVVLAMLIFASCEKPNKIGFVDNGTVINDYQEKKDVEAAFQLKEDAFINRLKGLCFLCYEDVTVKTEANEIIDVKLKDK